MSWVNLTYEVMGIGHSDMSDAKDLSLALKRYFRKLVFKFPIGMFRYRIGGSK